MSHIRKCLPRLALAILGFSHVLKGEPICTEVIVPVSITAQNVALPNTYVVSFHLLVSVSFG